ncbi:MAG: hypothetical protein QOC99_2911 [Acidobacteriota bacterium]|jgi:hypothetical protein|nr:hypothetical protein [Acidobacteriota bacterium]
MKALKAYMARNRARAESNWERARSKGKLYLFYRYLFEGLFGAVIGIVVSSVWDYQLGLFTLERFGRYLIIYPCSGILIVVLLWTLNILRRMSW